MLFLFPGRSANSPNSSKYEHDIKGEILHILYDNTVPPPNPLTPPFPGCAAADNSAQAASTKDQILIRLPMAASSATSNTLIIVRKE
jgi:hypothetical protein